MEYFRPDQKCSYESNDNNVGNFDQEKYVE